MNVNWRFFQRCNSHCASLYNFVQCNSQNPPSQRRPVPSLLSSHLSLQLALKMRGSLGKGLMPFFAAEALSLERRETLAILEAVGHEQLLWLEAALIHRVGHEGTDSRENHHDLFININALDPSIELLGLSESGVLLVKITSPEQGMFCLSRPCRRQCTWVFH